MIKGELQSALLDMLRRISDFLEEQGIRYYLFGGSCLGAMRHRGFLPWDDDVDLMMDRDNYRKLLACIDEWPWDDIDFFCPELNPEWYRVFAQFSSNENTVYMGVSVFNRGLSLGAKVDVMVMDYVPSDHLAEHVKNMILYEESANYVAVYKRDIIGDYLDEYEAIKRRQREVGRKAVLDSLRGKLEVYSAENSDRRVSRLTMRTRPVALFADWLEEPQYRDFEGLRLPVPSRPAACLRYQYGYDWYRIPPQEAQKVHSFYLNWNVPGIEYHKHLSNYLDFDGLEALCERRKLADIRRAAYRAKLASTKADLALQRLFMSYDFAEMESELKRCDQDELDTRVLELMDPLWLMIAEASLVPFENRRIPESIVRKWVIALVRSGRFYDGIRVLRAFHDGYEPPMTADDRPGELPKVGRFRRWMQRRGPQYQVLGLDSEALLDRVLSLIAAYQDNDMHALSREMELFSEADRRDIPDAILGLKKLKESGIAVSESWDTLLELCNRQLSINPDEFDIMKAKADLLVRVGRVDEAMSLYALVHERTLNGLDIMEMEAEFGFPSRFNRES